MWGFGTMLSSLKEGAKWRRSGWKGAYVQVRKPDGISDAVQPYIAMGTRGSLVPWSAAHEDILAEDWVRYVDESGTVTITNGSPESAAIEVGLEKLGGGGDLDWHFVRPGQSLSVDVPRDIRILVSAPDGDFP